VHSGRRKLRKRKSRKRLAYGIIAVAFILACFLVYSSLHSSPPKVAIVDQLSAIPGQSNQTFVDACKKIVEESGLTWAYYNGNKVTVNFYRNLPSCGTSLIILRVHSAIMRTETGIVSTLGLFTSELYSDAKAGTTYRSDIYFDGEYHNDSLFIGYFSGENIRYFAIGPKFVEERMNGKFQNTVIIMMGCEGLGYNITGARVTYTAMAEAFVKKGAKVYIGWDGSVSVNHTDQETLDLLQSLILEKRTIQGAVDEIAADPTYESELKFYPDGAGNYAIPNLRSTLIINIVHTLPITKASAKTKFRKLFFFPKVGNNLFCI
jgi:hypothetical protein